MSETFVLHPPDRHHCRFGLWLDGEGDKRSGVHPSMPQIVSLHQRIHDLADELLALHARGEKISANQRLEKLHALSDEMLEQMHVIVYQLEPTGQSKSVKT